MMLELSLPGALVDVTQLEQRVGQPHDNVVTLFTTPRPRRGAGLEAVEWLGDEIERMGLAHYVQGITYSDLLEADAVIRLDIADAAVLQIIECIWHDRHPDLAWRPPLRIVR